MDKSQYLTSSKLQQTSDRSEEVTRNERRLHGRSYGGGGFWGARDPPFVNFVLSKQPTTGGENEMTISE